MEEYDDLVPDPGEEGIMDMSHRGWKVADKVVWELGKRVLVLNLSFNKIQVLPEEIELLILLRDFNCEHNHIEEIPLGLTRCRRLRQLIMRDNNLTKIPPELGKCVMLEEIYLNGNRITEIPDTIAKCDVLNTLDCRNNKLDTVPPDIGAIITMRHLLLSGNDSLNHVIPTYLLDDAKMCIFILKIQYNHREEIRDLNRLNIELELQAKTKEERNLRIKDELIIAQEDYNRLKEQFPDHLIACIKRMRGCCVLS